MNLYLIRHAIAEDPGRRSDAERALTEEGKSKMIEIARGLAALGVELDLVLTSPLRRARETAEIVAAALGPVPIEVLSELASGAGAAAGARGLASYLRFESVAAVGHEPDLGELAALLLAGGPTSAAIRFRKGGVAALDLDTGARPLRAVLDWLATPKLIRSVRAGS